MRTKKLLFYLLAGLLGGCIPVLSLHPLYTEKDVVFDEKLLGVWNGDPNDTSNGTWEFRRSSENQEKAYELVFTDSDGKQGLFVVHLVKLEDRLFLDVYATELPHGPLVEDPNDIMWPHNIFFFVPAHTFIKINAIEPQLKMQLANDEDKMEKLLAEDPNAVKYEAIKDYRLVLTASTKELQEFVLKYADDDRVFTDEIVLTRKSTKDPNEPDSKCLKLKR
jgi:hypothetical protein